MSKHWYIGDTVVITERINGDDTPVGTCGEIIAIVDADSICVRLDGKWVGSDQYWTDGSNLELRD